MTETIKYPKELRNKNGIVAVLLFIALFLFALLLSGENKPGRIVVVIGFVLFFAWILYRVWNSEIYELTSKGIKITGEYIKKEQLIPYNEIKKIKYTQANRIGIRSYYRMAPSRLIYVYCNSMLPKCLTFRYIDDLEFNLFRQELNKQVGKFNVTIKDCLNIPKK